jgi:hypothetical protein
VGFYQYESNFESGDGSEWSAGETDTESRLSVDFYADLARKYPYYTDPLPYRGSYMLHGDLSISGTADGYVQDTTLATALAGTVWLRFYVKVTTDLVMAASDRFTIAAFQSAGPVDEAVVCIRNNAGAYEILISETSAGATVVASGLTLGGWHMVELGCVVDSGGGNDGTSAFYLDRYLQGTLTTVDQAAFTQLRMGIMGKDAGTTAGHVFFDAVVGHTAQIGGNRARNQEVMGVTKSIFLAQGPGRVDEYTLGTGAGQDDHMTLYDMDKLPLLAGTPQLGPSLGGSAPFQSVIGPRRKIYFNRGLYVVVSGTSPRGSIKFGGRQESIQPLLQYALKRSTEW